MQEKSENIFFFSPHSLSICKKCNLRKIRTKNWASFVRLKLDSCKLFFKKTEDSKCYNKQFRYKKTVSKFSRQYLFTVYEFLVIMIFIQILQFMVFVY